MTSFTDTLLQPLEPPPKTLDQPRQIIVQLDAIEVSMTPFKKTALAASETAQRDTFDNVAASTGAL